MIAVVENSLGTFKMKFYPNLAPKHVEHFKSSSVKAYNGPPSPGFPGESVQ
jgi:cyclophilin family peptidyl-prolyl cis-trans isomerase